MWRSSERVASQGSLARTKLWLPKETDHILHNETHSRQSVLKEKHFDWGSSLKAMAFKLCKGNVTAERCIRHGMSLFVKRECTKSIHTYMWALLFAEKSSDGSLLSEKSQLNTIKKKKIFLFTHIHDSHQPAVLLSVLASAKAAKCYALHNSLPVFLNTSRFYIYPFFSHPTTQDRTTHAIMSLQRRRKIKKYFFGQRSNRLQISAKRHAVIFVSF